MFAIVGGRWIRAFWYMKNLFISLQLGKISHFQAIFLAASIIARCFLHRFLSSSAIFLRLTYFCMLHERRTTAPANIKKRVRNIHATPPQHLTPLFYGSLVNKMSNLVVNFSNGLYEHVPPIFTVYLPSPFHKLTSALCRVIKITIRLIGWLDLGTRSRFFRPTSK